MKRPGLVHMAGRLLSPVAAFSLILGGCAPVSSMTGPAPRQYDISPAHWPADEEMLYLSAQNMNRSEAGYASGYNGAVTVAYSGYAARAGMEALRQGGNAVDAAMTSALAQVALTAGSPVSYFGIMSLVYYDARTGRTYTMNAEWNTLRGELHPATIPGGYGFHSLEAQRGLGDPSGRTVLVGGFMKGVESAHRRFGRLPFETLFQPAIHVAERGMPVSAALSEQLAFRRDDLARLQETRSTLLKPDGTAYREGEIFRQPALAATLRAIARAGSDYMYRGPWAERLVAAVTADGGSLTLEDLASYEVIWAEPLVAPIGNGYAVHTTPWPNSGGVALIEAQNLATVAKLRDRGHWSQSPEALRVALDISQQAFVTYLPLAMQTQLYPGLDLSPERRVTMEHAHELWSRMQAGAKMANWVPADAGPRHSDNVVAIDREGNIAAITHSINTIYWGKTAINVGGISVGDPASFQQAAVAAAGPGARLPAPTETGILFRDGRPVLGFASMGAGLHQRTFQGLLNFTQYGMSLRETANAPDFFLPSYTSGGQLIANMPEGRFPRAVLQALPMAYREVPIAEARLSGEGKWVAIRRDPNSGLLEAVSHNRNNSNAVAW